MLIGENSLYFFEPAAKKNPPSFCSHRALQGSAAFFFLLQNFLRSPSLVLRKAATRLRHVLCLLVILREKLHRLNTATPTPTLH